jgi:catechol 2,3-dioxygenase
VSDADRSRRFYEVATGLRATELDDGAIALGTNGGAPLVELQGDGSAPALDPRAPGLFHLAILLPSRLDLAIAFARLAQARIPLTGASDHLVSEALYLSDPDGNGIEIYRDRPRDEWQVRDGVLQMATIPLDLDSLIGELDDRSELSPAAPPGTRIGHVHLQVADLAEAERFYAGVLGFDVTVRGYPGALFVSAGGYHHHLGLNTWNSLGSPPPAPGSVGLESFEIVLPNADELDRVLGRARGAGVETLERPDGWHVRDPFGNDVVLRAR